MDLLVIFCATYLIVVPPVVLLVYVALASVEIKRKLTLLAAISLPIAYGVSKIADALYYNARPFVVDGVAPLVAHAAENGFPSNHMLLAAMVAALVCVYNRPLGCVLGAIALCIGTARVLAGVHHTLDIVGSVVIAAAVVIGVYVSIRRAPWYYSDIIHQYIASWQK